MFTPVQIFADWLIYNVFGIAKESRIGSALNFFVFDTIKIFILLLIIIYVITFIRSFFPPEKTRKILAKSKGSTFIGHVLAALLGIVNCYTILLLFCSAAFYWFCGSRSATWGYIFFFDSCTNGK